MRLTEKGTVRLLNYLASSKGTHVFEEIRYQPDGFLTVISASIRSGEPAVRISAGSIRKLMLHMGLVIAPEPLEAPACWMTFCSDYGTKLRAVSGREHQEVMEDCIRMNPSAGPREVFLAVHREVSARLGSEPASRHPVESQAAAESGFDAVPMSERRSFRATNHPFGEESRASLIFECMSGVPDQTSSCLPLAVHCRGGCRLVRALTALSD